jgi:phosphatidylserine/phosphatidylglycerophosphate/cardiolipin synthase-like enzyme
MKSIVAFGTFGLLAFLGSANATDNSTDLDLERMVVKRQDNSKVVSGSYFHCTVRGD